jgi:formate dehydrogenase subunit beta
MSRLNLSKSPNEGLKDLLRHLLASGEVAAVFSPRRNRETGSYDLALVTREEEIEATEPLAPVMIANAGQMLSMMTPPARPVAVVLKPCELRAFIERMKREQGTLENILTISYSCGGVFPLDKVTGGLTDDMIDAYWEDAGKGSIHGAARDTCKACEGFIPLNADVTVSVVGEGDLDGACTIYLNSEMAEKFTEGFGGDRAGGDFDASKTEELLKARTAGKKKLFDSLASDKNGLDALIDTFGKCVGCHGCSRVCPICYCLLCDFESMNFDNDFSYYEKELSQKGALRLPPDTVFFHIGRMIHMSFSCVGCGQCSDVCPADIPVAAVFKRTGEQTAAIFNYVAGRDLEEPIPVMVFKEEEFAEFVDD